MSYDLEYKNFKLKQIEHYFMFPFAARSGSISSCNNDCVLPESMTTNNISITTSALIDGCQSIYVHCPNGSFLTTLNAEYGLAYVYKESDVIFYCGNETKFYRNYRNAKTDAQCMNIFDKVDCLGMNNLYFH